MDETKCAKCFHCFALVDHKGLARNIHIFSPIKTSCREPASIFLFLHYSAHYVHEQNHVRVIQQLLLSNYIYILKDRVLIHF